MALYFLDSSALVKRYISEVGSAWILSLLNPASNPEFFVAAVASVLGYMVNRRNRAFDEGDI
jgi:uncharacterized protein